MNNIFNKNINALARRNKELADKLVSHIVMEIPELKKENDFYNLYYKGIPLHNPLNPLGEAEAIFLHAENTPITIHLIYGIGLGYLFQVAAKNSKGTVILYEPDLNIMKIAFTLVDFSEDIFKENVFIANTQEKTIEYLYRKSNTKNLPLMLSTTTYREMNKADFEAALENFIRQIGSFSLDLKYTKQKFYPLIKTIIGNIPQLAAEIPLEAIKDFYKGKTAVVVSAGPTLDRNIEAIKKYRDNIVLIVVGTAMKAIIKHNIKPDFLCIIESYDSSKQIAGLDLSDVNFVTEPYSNSNVRKFNFKQTYSHISDNMPVNNLWCTISGQKSSEYFSKGTVSYTALNVARILGCSKIVMAGQDLAYIEGQCYSKDSAYKDLECRFNKEIDRWEITAKNMDEFANALSNSPNENVRRKAAENRLRNLNNSLYYVKGINGDKIPTESVYAAFIKPLGEYTKLFPDREYINTSLVGAQIDGFKNMSAEEALKDTTPIENREIKTEYHLDIKKVKANIKLCSEKLSAEKNDVLAGQKAVKTINNDLKRCQSPNIETLKDLKKVSKIFLEISSKNANTLFDYITAAEKIELDYTMKITETFTADSVSNLVQKFAAYFNNAEKRIEEITGLLDGTLEKL